MSRALITQASRIFFGKAWHPGAHESKRGVELTPLYVYEATPEDGDADGICESQSVNAGVAASLDGALVVNGEAVFDVPRNVVAAWTNDAVLTIEGYDQYGEKMVEVTPNSGTSHTGKKAFKRVTKITPSGNVTSFTAGSGTVLGLPYRIVAGGVVLATLDGAIDEGTTVPGDTTNPATGTTGDVRGTYTPDGSLDGSARLQIILKIANPATREGAYGRLQYRG